jgi:hypothetical protein
MFVRAGLRTLSARPGIGQDNRGRALSRDGGASVVRGPSRLQLAALSKKRDSVAPQPGQQRQVSPRSPVRPRDGLVRSPEFWSAQRNL